MAGKKKLRSALLSSAAKRRNRESDAFLEHYTDPFVRAERTLRLREGGAKSDIRPCSSGSSA